jgi:hypothetical protein
MIGAEHGKEHVRKNNKKRRQKNAGQIKRGPGHCSMATLQASSIQLSANFQLNSSLIRADEN